MDLARIPRSFLAASLAFAACGPSSPHGDDAPCTDVSCSVDASEIPLGDAGGVGDAGWTRPPGPTPCGLRLTVEGNRDQFGSDTDLYLVKSDGSELTNLTYTPTSRFDDDAAWTRDGRRMAFRGGGRLLSIASDGTDERVLTPDGGGQRPAWSPDGTRLAYLDAGRLMLRDADGGNPRMLSTLGVFEARPPAWSPDGTSLAVTSVGDLYLVQVADGSARRLTTSGRAGAPVWSPTGDRIAFATPNVDQFQGLAVLTLATNQIVLLSDRKLSYTESSPTWSPDGQELIYSAELYTHPTAGLLRVHVDQRTTRLVYRAESLSAPRWSPDGSLIATQVYDGAAADVLLLRPDGQAPRRVNLPRDRFIGTLHAGWVRFSPCP